jgi:hypothetical protein
MGPLKGYNHQ